MITIEKNTVLNCNSFFSIFFASFIINKWSLPALGLMIPNTDMKNLSKSMSFTFNPTINREGSLTIKDNPFVTMNFEN
jgi:hypothetical protein